jgi:putative transposase
MAGGYPDGLRRGRPWCGTAPPTQLQRHSPTHAEFVTCNHTIEFTFRDAKQHWGLDDFMNVTETGVSNAANLSLLMVSLSAVLVRDARESDPQCSVLDLKASFRGLKYVAETIKLLPEKLDEGLIARIVCQVASLGRIHPPGASLKAA